MLPKRYHAFISHNSQDKSQVRKIVHDLFKHFSIWFDQADMLYGKDWVKQITQGLQDSDVCLIFVGENGLGKSQEKEIQIAKDIGARICCVFLPGAVPEQIYDKLQIPNTTMYANYMEGNNRTAYESLAASIYGKPVGWEFLSGVKLEKSAEEWTRNKSKKLLYKGDELREAHNWQKKHPDEISDAATAFLKVSSVAQNIRRAIWVVTTIFTLVIIGLLAAFSITRQPAVNAANTQSAFQQATAQIANTQADEQHTIAKSEQLAALALTQLDQKLDLSLLLSVEAYQRAKTSQTSRTLYLAWQHNPKLKQYIHLDHPIEIGHEVWAWSSNRLAVSNSQETIIVWDLQSGKPIQTLEGHKDAIVSIEWSSDGHLASGDKGGTIIVWDLQNGKPAQILSSPMNTAAYIVWSNDNHLAANIPGTGIIVWDLQNNEPVQIIQEKANIFISFTWSKDSRSIFILSNNAIIVWDFQNNEPAKIIDNIIPAEIAGSTSGDLIPDNRITHVDWSDDGRLAYVIHEHSADSIIVWDSQNSGYTQTLSNSFFFDYQTQYRFSNIKWSNDGRLAATVREKIGIVIWNIKNNEFDGQPEKILPPLSNYPLYRIETIAWSNDGVLASASSNISDTESNGIVTIWDIQNGTPAQTLQGHTDSVLDMDWLSEGVLASASFDQTIIIWDLQRAPNKQIIIGNDLLDKISSVAWSDDGQLASGGGHYISGNELTYDKTVIIWDLLNNKPRFLNGHTGLVNSVAWSRDGQLASGSGDDKVIIWDLESGNPAQILTGHSEGYGVDSVAWSDDGQLASIEGDGSFIIWDLQTGLPTIKISSTSTAIAWSHDGQLFADYGIWDLKSRELTLPLEYVISAAWSKDNILATASGLIDNTVVIWDLQSGKAAQTLYGHTDTVTTIAWSNDGRFASGSQDGTIIIWDLPSGQPAQTLKGNTGGITSIAWSNDEKLASASQDSSANTITIWEVSPDNWIKQSCQRAGRNLTQEEWNFYFPGETYRQTCTILPNSQNLPTPTLARTPIPTPKNSEPSSTLKIDYINNVWDLTVTLLCCFSSLTSIVLLIVLFIRIIEKRTVNDKQK